MMKRIFFLILTIVVIMFLFREYVFFKNYGGNRNWPSTGGQVVCSEVKSYWCNFGHSPFGTCYKPKVQYQYSIGGRTYLSNQISFGSPDIGNRHNRTPAEMYIYNYPPGKQVIVYYNPQNPAYAVMQPSTAETEISSMIFIILIAGIFIYIGIMGILGILGKANILSRKI